MNEQIIIFGSWIVHVVIIWHMIEDYFNIWRYRRQMKQEWINVMKEQIDAIERNETWELVNLPISCNAIGVKWIYMLKSNIHGSGKKHKVRLVAEGYFVDYLDSGKKHYGVDYFEMFSPKARFESIHILLLSITTQMEWEVYQFGVKSEFLNGYIDEDVYVEKLEGFIIEGNENKM